jgi:flavin reductase (DIM6/NTAB) family NADH-FMN oxidoreductase RutF
LTKRYFDLVATENRDSYKLLSGLVVPRPIGWIGTKRRNGSFNLAPFSFFNVVSTSPPTVLFSGSRHSDRPKDSVALAEESGEFTVNIVSEDVAPAMSVTSGSFGPDDDEFKIAGLTAVMGTVVNAPMVAESPANLECHVTKVLDVGEGVTRIVVGRVVALHVDDSVLDGTRIDARQLRAVGRMSGNTYITTDHLFEMEPPLPPYLPPERSDGGSTAT